MSAQAASRDARTLGAFAAACAALVFVVVASSAWLRLGAAPCPPGGCAGFGLADAVRLAHRVAAMGVTVLALVIAALAWKAPARPGLRAASVLLIVLVAALAVIGRRSAGAAPPAVLLANLLGGLALLGACVGIASAATAPRGRIALPFAAAAGLLAAAIAAGGVLAIWPAAGPSPLALAHRGLGWSALAAWALIAASSAPAPGVRLAARLAALALLAQLLLVVSVPEGSLVRWLHNLLSACALAAAVAATLRARLAPCPPEPAERAFAGP
jgi:heme A synthase